MKKLIAVIICIALITGIGLVVLEKSKKQFSVENILPQEALAYVQINDVANNFKKLESFSFWQGFRDINYDVLVQNKIMDSQQLMWMELIKSQLMEVINSPFSSRLLGQELIFAAYSPEMDLSSLVSEMKLLSPKFFEELLSGFFLVTRIEADMQAAEFISRFFSQFSGDILQGQVEYKGEVIRTINVTNIGMSFGLVRINDLIVLGVGDKAARISIDVYKGDRLSLANDPLFEQIQKRTLNPSHLVGYFSFEPLYDILNRQSAQFISSGQGQGDAQARWDQVLSRITGLKAFGFSTQLSSVVRLENYLVLNPAELSPELTLLYSCPSDENKTIQFVPKEVLGYQWSNCFELDNYWKQVTEGLKQSNTPTSGIDTFESELGLNIELDILPAFGSEIGGYVQDVIVGGFIPIPKLLLFVQVKDRAKAQQLLNKLQDQPISMIQEEAHQGVTLKYLALPLGQDIQPGYAFLEDYFLLSTSRNLIKDSIDAYKDNSKSLLASLDFETINFGLTGNNRMVQFFKIGEVIGKLKGVIDWSNGWMAMQEKKTQAFKAGSGKPLQEVNAMIAVKKGELAAMEDQLIPLEDEIWNMETKGLDVSANQAELDSLKVRIDAKRNEIAAEEERKSGLTNIVNEYDQGPADSAQRQLVLDEIIYPVLESLKSIQSYGLRSTINENVVETSLFLNVSD